MHHSAPDRGYDDLKIASATEVALDEAGNAGRLFKEFGRLVPLESWIRVTPIMDQLISDTSNDFQVARKRLPKVALKQCYGINLSQFFGKDGSGLPLRVRSIVITPVVDNP